MTAREQTQRTCVGCRQKDDRGALLRFVVAGDPPQVVPDVVAAVERPRRVGASAQALPGRGGAQRLALRRCAGASRSRLTRTSSRGGRMGSTAGGLAGLLTLRSAAAASRSAPSACATRSRCAARRLLVVAGDAADRDELMRRGADGVAWSAQRASCRCEAVSHKRLESEARLTVRRETRSAGCRSGGRSTGTCAREIASCERRGSLRPPSFAEDG